MATDDAAAPGVMPGSAPIWQDMRYLSALDNDMHLGVPSNSRDGGDMWEVGYKPRPPKDPRWLVIATIMCFLLTIAAFVYVIVSSNY